MRLAVTVPSAKRPGELASYSTLSTPSTRTSYTHLNNSVPRPRSPLPHPTSAGRASPPTLRSKVDTLHAAHGRAADGAGQAQHRGRARAAEARVEARRERGRDGRSKADGAPRQPLGRLERNLVVVVAAAAAAAAGAVRALEAEG
eukprot:1748875-Prymnesium_polylepis.1